MGYQPTGRPPGRPKVTKTEPVKPEPAKPDNELSPPTRTVPVIPAVGLEGTELTATGVICLTCFPDGWYGTATGVNCTHGVWTRRLFA